jgi:hypothetical protein
MSKISIYRGNSVIIKCDVFEPDGSPKDLADFTSTIYVKRKKSQAGYDLEKEGVNAGNEITFSLTASDTQLPASTYYYEIRIESLTEIFTVTVDILQILDSLG